MVRNRIIFVCNALEDGVRLERNISTDSPACSRKIFQMAKALKFSGERVLILSMGRGNSGKNNSFHLGKSKITNGISVIYAPFSELKIISEIISLFSLPYILFRLRLYSGSTSVVFWNRTSAYILALFISLLLGFSRFLDLEDGDLQDSNWTLGGLYIILKRKIYNHLCSSGSIISCKALSSSLGRLDHLCYYGVSENNSGSKTFDSNSRIVFLLGGTVSVDTGALTLVNAIKLLRQLDKSFVNRVEFVITGKGDCIHLFEQLGNIDDFPKVKVMGRLSDIEYNHVLASASVGLALKQLNGPLALTTFPSKVIEMAGAGLLIITTDISDVRDIFGDNGAIYLSDDEPESLVRSICWILDNPIAATAISARSADVVKNNLSLRSGGIALKNFLRKNNVN